MTQVPDNLPAGTTHFCPAFGRYPDRAMQLRRGDNWAYWTGFSWFEVQCGPPPGVRREMIDVREQAQWNGEGLPPVGLEVEAWYSMDTLPGWKLFKLKYYSEESVVFEGLGETYASRETFDRYGLKFRPIRTAEQIAAEEREKAIDAMNAIAVESVRLKGHTGRETCATLYDAGYRKVEK